MTEIIQQLILAIFLFFMAGRDSSSIKLMGNYWDELTTVRKDRWHRDSVALYLLICIPFIFWGNEFNWKVIIAALLLRVSLFDPALNYYMGWNIRHIGTTATWDRAFSKVFGKKGALKKSGAFLIILIILNILNKIL